MVVDPHDGYHQETESVANEYGRYFPERGKRGLRGRAKFQDHDGHDNCDYTVAESFQATGRHFATRHWENLPRRCDSGRLLLRHTMHRPQPPDEIPGIDRHN